MKLPRPRRVAVLTGLLSARRSGASRSLHVTVFRGSLVAVSAIVCLISFKHTVSSASDQRRVPQGANVIALTFMPNMPGMHVQGSSAGFRPVAPGVFASGEVYLVGGSSTDGGRSRYSGPARRPAVPRRYALSARGFTAALTIEPARAGLNQMSVTLRYRNGRPVTRAEIRVLTTMMDMPMARGLGILQPKKPGAFAGRYNFGMRGRWKLGFLVYLPNGVLVPLSVNVHIAS